MTGNGSFVGKPNDPHGTFLKKKIYIFILKNEVI